MTSITNKYFSKLEEAFESDSITLSDEIDNNYEKEAVEELLKRNKIKFIESADGNGGFYVSINNHDYDGIDIRAFFWRISNKIKRKIWKILW